MCSQIYGRSPWNPIWNARSKRSWKRLQLRRRKRHQPTHSLASSPDHLCATTPMCPVLFYSALDTFFGSSAARLLAYQIYRFSITLLAPPAAAVCIVNISGKSLTKAPNIILFLKLGSRFTNSAIATLVYMVPFSTNIVLSVCAYC